MFYLHKSIEQYMESRAELGCRLQRIDQRHRGRQNVQDDTKWVHLHLFFFKTFSRIFIFYILLRERTFFTIPVKRTLNYFNISLLYFKKVAQLKIRDSLVIIINN